MRLEELSAFTDHSPCTKRKPTKTAVLHTHAVPRSGDVQMLINIACSKGPILALFDI